MAKKKKPKAVEEMLESELFKRMMALSCREAPSNKPWHPAKYQCPDCKTIISSWYPGHFSECECEKCFVDQTRYYALIGGSPELIDPGKEKELGDE